jgi:hypothetical protein
LLKIEGRACFDVTGLSGEIFGPSSLSDLSSEPVTSMFLVDAVLHGLVLTLFSSSEESYWLFGSKPGISDSMGVFWSFVVGRSSLVMIKSASDFTVGPSDDGVARKLDRSDVPLVETTVLTAVGLELWT